MAWRDEIQESSFRGVKFLEKTDQEPAGRRINLHEFPLRDDAVPEDMGGVSGVINVTGFVIGPDYIKQKNALRDALNKEGAGTLVRRLSGQMRVRAGKASIVQTNEKGGMATFTMTFYADGEQPLPTVSANTQKIVANKADTALNVVQKQFEQDFTIQGLPAWVSEEAQTMISDLESLFTPASSANSTINDYINLPSDLAGQVIGLIGSLSSATEFRGLLSFGDDAATVPTTTPSRQQQAANQAAIINLVRSTAVIEASRQASTDDYDSAQQAIATRNELADALDEQSQTADDDSYRVLQDVRIALVNDMTTRAANLKQINSYTPQASLPAVVLAHRLYQDPLRDQDIINRNAVKHPGFVPGGYALEVTNA